VHKFYIVSLHGQMLPLPSVDIVKAHTKNGNVIGYREIEDAAEMLKKLRKQYPYHKFKIVTYAYLTVYD